MSKILSYRSLPEGSNINNTTQVPPRVLLISACPHMVKHSTYTDFPCMLLSAGLVGASDDAVGTSSPLFRNRIQATKRTCSEIFCWWFITLLVTNSNEGEDSGLLPNVQTGPDKQASVLHGNNWGGKAPTSCLN